ncbi:Solute carrier family 52, riboflavin transporter, member 3 [Strongyloides ratti]|uniref:Riboflavin transporter n=1 Tax=Strongyloides ratti TaxID=34506 RepID=A0A090MZR5_STRRB|nr:Solute carrier family 52, riboflavin transporter, member 3 [Strongyloides ratti]CEF69394.1 Solute carrier family 52, riboflavin transporter, member 3 [Strongyloides ratti]
MDSGRLFVASVIFGSSTWFSTNAVWLELPILTQRLPEGWSLPSFLSAIIQIACIGPLIYSICFKCIKIRFSSGILITLLLLFCTMCTFLTSIYWSDNVTIFEKKISLPLMILVFGMALVNATSNVLFMPYMASFDASLLNAFFLGMSFSSLIPSLISLSQGTGRYECVKSGNSTKYGPEYYDPSFSAATFFQLSTGWLVITIIAFLYLEKKYREKRSLPIESDDDDDEGEMNEMSKLNSNIETQEPETKKDNTRNFVIQLFLLAFTSAQNNAIIPSLSSFAALPYSQTTYHLTLALSNISAPVACILPFFLNTSSLPIHIFLTIISTIACGVLIFFAANSPKILISVFTGSGVVIFTSIIVSGLLSYLRSVITSSIRNSVSPTNAHNRLFWSGCVMQMGSFIAALVIFPLVNIFNLFHAAVPCSEWNV